MVRASLVELQCQLYLWNSSWGMSEFTKLPRFSFPPLELFCRFSYKKPPNCFRSPCPLVSAGICLQVFNAAEWQMRIKDHEMASSLHGQALGDSQTLLSYTAAVPTPTLTQKSIFWKKKNKMVWLNTSSKNSSVWEVGGKPGIILHVLHSWPLVEF